MINSQVIKLAISDKEYVKGLIWQVVKTLLYYVGGCLVVGATYAFRRDLYAGTFIFLTLLAVLFPIALYKERKEIVFAIREYKKL